MGYRSTASDPGRSKVDPRWLGDAHLRTRGGGSRLLRCASGQFDLRFSVHHRERGNDVSPASAPAVHGLNGWVTRDHLGELILPLLMVAEADGRASWDRFTVVACFPTARYSNAWPARVWWLRPHG